MPDIAPARHREQYGEGVAGGYSAEIVEAGDGVRLRPAGDASIPTDLTEVHLLGLAIALAMGAAGYEHHPRPRDPESQTIDGLLAGEVTMPWRMARPPAGGEAGAARVVCDRSGAGSWKCRVEAAGQ
jgi:hypothetical protein